MCKKETGCPINMYTLQYPKNNLTSFLKSEGEDPSAPWTSIERQDLMRRYYPELVEAYEESIKKPVKEKKTKGRKKKDKTEDVDVINVDVNKPKKKHDVRVKNKMDKNRSHNSTANVSVCVNKLKRKLKAKKGQKTIDSFIRNKRRKSNIKLDASSKINFKTFAEIFEALNSDKVAKNSILVDNNKENENIHRLSMLSLIDNNDDTTDASDIVESILHRNIETKFAQIDNRIYKLVYNKNSTPKKSISRKSLTSRCIDCSTPTESPIRKRSLKNISDICNRSYDKLNESHKNIRDCSVSNTSYFFDKLTDERDAFELSMDYANKCKSGVISINSTIDYSLPDIQL